MKNDNADYTISDEHVHDMKKVAHQPEWEVETPKTRIAIAKKLSKETDPEGYVVQHKGRITKMVDRGEFSRANFAKPKEWKK